MSSYLGVKPKRVHVFVNGNPTGRIFFIHPKCSISWSSIINFIGDLLKPQGSPIKVLRRVDGTSVTSYDELVENGKYIACGREPLISIQEGYRTDSEIEFQRDFRESVSSQIMTTDGNDVRYLTKTDKMNIITIYVFVNGQKTKPYKISLLQADLGKWAIILSIISKQIKMSVNFLYTIFGEKLKEPTEIQHRGFYVALEEDSFQHISYLSVFSTQRDKKIRFKEAGEQAPSTLCESSILSNGDNTQIVKNATPVRIPIQIEEQRRNFGVINLNDPTSESPCIHLTIVQKPFSATRHLPGVPATVCALKPSAKLIVEMMNEQQHEAICHLCKTTQTSAVFCEAQPKGKCVIEVASKKFHIISDEETIVLPCGTYFSSNKSMKKPCTFPQGNQNLSLEDIANRIVGIVVDTSEYCANRAIYGVEPRTVEIKKVPEKREELPLSGSTDEILKGVMEDVLKSKEYDVPIR